MSASFITLFIFIFSPALHAARILAVTPTPTHSHQVVFRPLLQELAGRGHALTIITAKPIYTRANSPANFTEIDVHHVSNKIWKDSFKEHGGMFGKKKDIYKHVEVVKHLIEKTAEIQMKTEQVQDFIMNKKNTFDLLLIEEWSKPYLTFSHIFKAPVILISSFGKTFGMDDVIGAPGHVFLYPNMGHQRLYNLTFWEKLEEMYKHFWVLNKWLTIEEDQYKTFKRLLGSDLPRYGELNNNIDMVFLNMHPIFSNNQPLPPNVISIWGIYKKPEKDLPQDLQSYLDSSKNGVVYLSFGTTVPSSLLTSDKIQLLINVFSKLPYDVLWKWDEDELPREVKNIRISKWLPQSDLLRHPNIKLFITQGGLQSTDEAINAGVPLIGIPVYGDQWYNVEQYEHHKIGVGLVFEELSEDILSKAIKTVISDKRYRENVIKLRTLMRDQPESALQRAVWWTEYVLRHGGAKHLRARGANKSWMEYYEIQFVFILAGLAISVFVVIFFTLYLLLTSIVSKAKIKVS